MKAVLNASQASILLGCGAKRIQERMKAGYWKIGIIIPSKNKSGNNTYEIIPKKLAEQFGVPVEEVYQAWKEKRPIRVAEGVLD